VNLDFLAVDAAGAADAADPAPRGSGPPIARSPMERRALAAGAEFEVRDGWNVAIGYGSGADREAAAAAQTAGWADTSHLAKLELQGSAEALESAAATALPFGAGVRLDDAWWCRLTDARALVVGAGTAAKERIGEADGIDAVDVTSNFAALTLVGPASREVFARFSALDLRPAVAPVGAVRPGSIARQPGIVICEAEDRYLLLFGWATGEYIWSVVADAGTHLGGQPIGALALAKLSEPEAARA
jgi:glycine cleavage system aminomethyltransferase T